jgi:hypothetical protein
VAEDPARIRTPPTPAQLRRGARANERRRKDARNARIYELWKAGLSARAISEHLTAEGEPIGATRVNQIIHAGMEMARAAREKLSVEIFDGELDRLSAIIRTAWTVVTAQCRICHGRGAVDGIGGVGATAVPCVACEMTGYLNRPDTRIRAMKETRNAIDQRAKMLGLYAPEKFAMTDGAGNDVSAMVRADLAAMPADDIDKALTDYMAGIDAARALDAAES